jgi:hypothetical protein
VAASWTERFQVVEWHLLNCCYYDRTGCGGSCTELFFDVKGWGTCTEQFLW